MAGVRILVQFTADSAEIAEERIRTMVERARKTEAEEQGCLQYEIFRSAMRPEQYALLEHWESREALDKHRELLGQRPRPQADGTRSAFELYEHQPGSF
ncbi:MAG: antibiotic biosynthesis monooxygenase [Chloroflexota bacterium]|nr:antibiotic biosynthesis monooxygenase [Chloroflexota bacterium]